MLQCAFSSWLLSFTLFLLGLLALAFSSSCLAHPDSFVLATWSNPEAICLRSSPSASVLEVPAPCSDMAELLTLERGFLDHTVGTFFPTGHPCLWFKSQQLILQLHIAPRWCTQTAGPLLKYLHGRESFFLLYPVDVSFLLLAICGSTT